MVNAIVKDRPHAPINPITVNEYLSNLSIACLTFVSQTLI
jgi:hypothetical protein